jgi:hypothetical protein
VRPLGLMRLMLPLLLRIRRHGWRPRRTAARRRIPRPG